MIELRPFSPEIVWNKDTLDALSPHVGADKLKSILGLFATILSKNILEMRETPPRMIRREIHDLSSTSGFLGFERLYHACVVFLVESKPSEARRRVLMSEMENASRELKHYLTVAGA